MDGRECRAKFQRDYLLGGLIISQKRVGGGGQKQKVKGREGKPAPGRLGSVPAASSWLPFHTLFNSGARFAQRPLRKKKKKRITTRTDKQQLLSIHTPSNPSVRPTFVPQRAKITPEWAAIGAFNPSECKAPCTRISTSILSGGCTASAGLLPLVAAVGGRNRCGCRR